LVNKFSKEEIKLGFDSNFIYHRFIKRKNKLNLFFLIKKEERSISRITSIQKMDPKKFVIIFDNDEKFQYQTKTTVGISPILYLT
jgi:pyruvate kinase